MDLGKFKKERTITREPAQAPQRITPAPPVPTPERELVPA